MDKDLSDSLKEKPSFKIHPLSQHNSSDSEVSEDKEYIEKTIGISIVSIEYLMPKKEPENFIPTSQETYL